MESLANSVAFLLLIQTWVRSYCVHKSESLLLYYKIYHFCSSPDSHLANMKNTVALSEQIRLISRVPNVDKDIQLEPSYIAGKKYKMVQFFEIV